MPVKNKAISEKKKVIRKKTVIPSETRNLSRMRDISNKLRDSSASPQNDKIATRSGLSIPVYSLAGVSSGTLILPKEVFGAKVNKKLLAQALRVYGFNQKSHTASTKTRGEVRGSTAKVWRQKGTGRARHGSKRAPIFVGGGIVFGPEPRNVKLDLPQKMKKAALISALSSKTNDKEVVGVSGVEKASGKTKEFVKLMNKLSIKSGLLVTGQKEDMAVRGVRNIPGINVLSAAQLNAYEVIKHKMLVVTKDAVEALTK